MKAAAFDHQRAQDAAQAARALAEAGGRAKLIAGGQSLGPMLNLRLTRPQLLVDIGGLSALEEVRPDGEQVIVGAGVRHAAIEDGRYPALAGHPMQQVAAGIAYRAIRNKGTVGGSLAHADPAADWVLALVAMGALLKLHSPRGEREMGLGDFIQAAYTTALQDDELIVSVTVPRMAQGRWGYYKFCRKPGEFADASAAVCQVAAGAPWTVALGALDGPPQLLPALSAQLQEGAALGQPQLRAAVAAALPERDPIDNQLHAVCLARALTQAGWPVSA